MKKIIALTLLFLPSLSFTAAAQIMPQRLSGRILLQVQSHGQAWYVNQTDQKRYGLGRPDQALFVMRQLGIGISSVDLNKISRDNNFTKKHLGKIFLQVEDRGQAWYVNPIDQKKYFLGRPADALEIMKRLALGISDADLASIPEGRLILKITAPYTPTPSQSSLLDQAADSIRKNDSPKVEALFIPEMRKAIAYTMTALSAESRLLLANILFSAKLESQADEQKTYSAQAYFSLGGYNVPLRFYVKKQTDGAWLITNL